MIPTQDKSYFCPKCSSALVSFSPLYEGRANCDACSWEGLKDDLSVHYFKHEHGSNEDAFREFFVEFKTLFAKSLATPLAALLYKWGFFKGKPTPSELGRYFMAIGEASMKALVEERKKIEMERNRAGN
jgi:hypothetical protein